MFFNNFVSSRSFITYRRTNSNTLVVTTTILIAMEGKEKTVEEGRSVRDARLGVQVRRKAQVTVAHLGVVAIK